jgi:glucose/arabinose dehydrogenase
MMKNAWYRRRGNGRRDQQRHAHGGPTTATAIERLEERCLFAVLPAGFSETLVASGVSSVTAMEFAPDGKLHVASQTGRMEVWQNGTRLQADFFRDTPLATQSISERGLLGIAFSPNFATNRFVYVYYTTNAADNHNRVSRFKANATGDLALAGSENVIMDLDAHSAGNHNGGAIHFGPDHLLYIATGDNAQGANAQSLANRHGKILRIDPAGDDFPADPNQDYRIPTGNPTTFAGVSGSTSGLNRSIVAVGLRNPFTFAFQPGTGRLFINDVGQNTWEEINDFGLGRNYGWPTTEGDFNQSSFPAFTRPFYTYDHDGAEPNGIAIAGGAFYNPATTQFPAEYVGDYFFADLGGNTIWRIDTTSKAVTPFAREAGNPVDLKVDNAGNLYYLAHTAGRVFRVSNNSAPPVITDHPDSRTVTLGASVTFNVVASGNGPLTYKWQRAEPNQPFIDIPGATAASYTLTSAQASDSKDRFRVVVGDAAGRLTPSNAAVLTVTTNRAPTATVNLSSGLRNGRFDAGRTITFGGSASDPEQGSLPASRFTWRVDYLTTRNGGDVDGDGLPGVTRPFVQPFSGKTSGSFTPATTGPYTLTDVGYVVTLTVTDSGGLTDVERVLINPNTVTLTVATNPSGLRVTVDGQPFTAPRTFGSVVGFKRPIGVDSTSQTLGGTTYTFVAWSDAGAATHTINTPATNATYTAGFRAPTGLVARINFQNASSSGFTGYTADTGAVFGARGGGLTFGWNIDNRAHARNRNLSASPDERYDTLNHMQKPGGATSWSLAVPNGSYAVRLVAGDTLAIDSIYRLNVESTLAINGTPSSTKRWFDNTIIVNVADGLLTLSNASGSSNNKISFMEINQVGVV